MKISRRQQLLAGGLALSGLVFSLDRRGQRPASAVARPGPDPDASAALLVDAAPADAAAGASAAAPPPRAQLELLAERLCAPTRNVDDALETLLPARDPFVRRIEPDPTTAPIETHASATAAAASPAPAPATAAPAPSFEERHTLQGIILGPVPMAWIDGRRVQIGGEVDGMLVVRIRRDAVTLRRGDETAVLRVPPRSARRP